MSRWGWIGLAVALGCSPAVDPQAMDCGAGCVDGVERGAANVCTPKSCAELHRFCGRAEDGCGATIDCGPCACEVHEDLGSAVGIVRQADSPRHVYEGDLGSGWYMPIIDAYLWSAPRSGWFVISGGMGAIQPAVRTGHCVTGQPIEPGDRYLLEAGQQVWITFVGDGGSRWAMPHNFYRLSINAATPSETGLCTNGLDDDGDTLLDCHDPECAATPECAGAACADAVASTAPVRHPVVAPRPSTSRFDPGGKPQIASADAVLLWTAPKSGTWVFHPDADALGDYAGLISLYASCGGPELAFSAETHEWRLWDGIPEVSRVMQEGESVLVVLEGTRQYNSPGGIPDAVLIHEREPEGGANCADGRDNDGDRWPDSYDDDCRP